MIRNFLRTVLALFLFVALLGGALWFYPEVFLNARTMRWTLDRLGMRDTVRWRTLTLDFTGAGGLMKRLVLKADSLRITDAPAVDLDIRRLELELCFGFRRLGFVIASIDRLQADANHIRVDDISTTPESQDQAADEYALDLRLPRFRELIPGIRRETEIGRIDVSAREVRVAGVVGKAAVRSLAEEDSRRKRLLVQADFLAGDVDVHADLATVLDLEQIAVHARGFLRVRVGREEFAGQTRLEWNDAFLAFLDLDWRSGRKRPMPIRLELWEKGESFRIRALSEQPRIAGLPIRLANAACDVRGRLDENTGEPTRLDLQCPFSYRMRRESGFKFVDNKSWDGEVAFGASLERNGKRLRFREAKLSAKTQAQDLALEMNFAGVVDADLSEFRFDDLRLDALDGRVDIAEFGRLVASLDGSDLAVPAPLRTLRGPIHATLRGAPEGTAFRLAADVDLRLRDSVQSFQVAAAGQLDIPGRSIGEVMPQIREGRLVLDAGIDLEDVALEVPYVDVTSLPAFLPDTRFRPRRRGNSRDDRELLLNLAIRTTDRPVRLYSNLFRDPVSLNIDYRFLANGRTQGKLSVNPMNISFFRRNVQLERMILATSGKTDTSQIDGVLTYGTSEVLVRIYIVGPADAPRVEFESDPPLSRDQIISVLVFNSSLDDLTEENQQSASSLGQALSSGALSLTAMYLLASTPVESVQFDPATRTYSARLRLTRTASVSIGSDAPETQNYGIGKRFGRRLSLRTELRSSPDRPNTVSTMLRWFMRY